MVLVGWLLGGTVGVGTAVFAFGIGPLIQVALRLLRVDLSTPGGTPEPTPAAGSVEAAGDAAGISGGAGR